jgi:peptidyl-Lys metalloendopeptidase
MRQFATCFILALATVGVPDAHAQDLSAHRKACSVEQKSAIDAAQARGRLQLGKAIAAVQATGPADIERYVRWFGAPSSTKVAAVKTGFERAYAMQVFTQVWCPLTNDAVFEWIPGDNAAVHPNFRTEIFIGPNYFNLPVTGLGSRAGTIIHEWMHLAGYGLQRPEIYTVPEVLALASANSDKARDNANNFRYFAEEVP